MSRSRCTSTTTLSGLLPTFLTLRSVDLTLYSFVALIVCQTSCRLVGSRFEEWWKCWSLVFFPFKKNYAALAVVNIWAPWKSLRRGGRGRERGGQAESERSWRHRSDGTPYLTTGRTEFVEMAGSSSLSERWLYFLNALALYRGCKRRFSFICFIVLLPFSNRCLSCSDKTHSTTWLHPRTGEPVNSGHMIRSGTRQTIRFVG